MLSPMVYPGQPVPAPLPQFVGTATVKQTPAQRQALLEHVEQGYLAGKSLRFLAAETDRSQGAIRRALDQAGVVRRGPGAPPTGHSHRKTRR